jgi:hypothetical protein
LFGVDGRAVAQFPFAAQRAQGFFDYTRRQGFSGAVNPDAMLPPQRHGLADGAHRDVFAGRLQVEGVPGLETQRIAYGLGNHNATGFVDRDIHECHYIMVDGILPWGQGWAPGVPPAQD